MLKNASMVGNKGKNFLHPSYSFESWHVCSQRDIAPNGQKSQLGLDWSYTKIQDQDQKIPFWTQEIIKI